MVTLGAVLVAGLLAVGIFVALIVIASGLAIALIAGVVTAVRRYLDDQEGSPGQEESAQDEEILDIEEIETFPLPNRTPEEPDDRSGSPSA